MTVSVVIPVYNGDKYIHQTIESLYAQTIKNFEIIFVNDGSTDLSKKIIESYNDSRFKIINFKTNRGIVAAMNAGVEASTGSLIARLDADDYASPQRLEIQLNQFIQNSKLVLLGSDVKKFSNNFFKNILYSIRSPITNQEKMKWRMLFVNPIVHSTVMFKKATFFEAGMYTEASHPAEDYDLWLRMSKLGDIKVLNQKLVFYRVHNESISSNKTQKMYDKAESIARHFRLNETNYNIRFEDSFKKNIIVLSQFAKEYLNKNSALTKDIREFILNDIEVLALKYSKRRFLDWFIFLFRFKFIRVIRSWL